MASLLPPLVQTLRGDASQLTATYKEVSGEADAMAASTDAAGNKISATHAKVAASANKMGQGVLLGTAAVLGLSTAAAVAAQTVDAKLSVSIKNAGGSFDALKPKIDAADAAGNKLGFTNDQINSGLATLTTALGSPKKALADLAVAQDVARVKGVDLSTASLAVAKAAGGQATALQRLGIVIPTSALNGLTTASQKGAAIMDVLKGKVGGTADAYGKTLKGQLQAAGAQFDSIGISIGNKVIPVLTKVLQGAMAFFNFLDKNKGVATAIAVGLGVVAAALAAYSIATGIADAITAVFGLTEAVALAPILAIVVGIGVLIAIIILLATHWKQVTDFIKTVWKAVAGWFKSVGDSIVNWWNGFWKGIGDFAVTVFKDYIGIYITIFKTLYNGAVAIGTDISKWWTGLWNGIFGWLSSLWKDEVKGWTDIFNTVLTVFQSIGTNISKWWTGFWSGLGSLASGIFKNTFNFVTTIINDVINAINTITSALNTAGGAIGINIKIGKIPDLPSFDVGTSGVPGPTGAPLLAVVHGGEPVLSNKMMAGQAKIPANVVNAVNTQQGGGVDNSRTINATFNTNADPGQIQASLGWLLARQG